MKHLRLVFAAVLGMAFVFLPASRLAAAATLAESPDISGVYHAKGNPRMSLTLTTLAPGTYRAVGVGWEGVGLVVWGSYLGVFRQSPGSDAGAKVTGTHRGTIAADGSLTLRTEYDGGNRKVFEAVWVPTPKGGPPPRSELPVPSFENPVWPPRDQAPNSDRLPAPGDYVYVEELPEAITKVPPVYPDAARAAGVKGTVLVQALVGKDGRVAEAKIVKSIPELDEAAVNAVRQWVFKPALSGGKPVAVWVAVPVRFPPP